MLVGARPQRGSTQRHVPTQASTAELRRGSSSIHLAHSWPRCSGLLYRPVPWSKTRYQAGFLLPPKPHERVESRLVLHAVGRNAAGEKVGDRDVWMLLCAAYTRGKCDCGTPLPQHEPLDPAMAAAVAQSQIGSAYSFAKKRPALLRQTADIRRYRRLKSGRGGGCSASFLRAAVVLST